MFISLLQLDLADQRETHNEKDVADKLDIDRCFESSSKDGRGIDEVVDFLLEEVRAPDIYILITFLHVSIDLKKKPPGITR